jgi:FKBP-type peptidyl-prolyl cis-trans isomerase SlpA
VRLAHRLTLAEGTVVEESTAEEPLEFTVGDGTLPAALEARLLGLREGMRASFVITSDQLVFGPRDPGRLQRVARADFPESDPPAAGVIHAFHLPNGMDVIGTIMEVGDEEVLVDFNPPLAGRDFVFDVTVLRAMPGA